MSISKDIREQLLSSFRAELAEHVQTMTDGLLEIEQRQMVEDARQEILKKIFRSAHSLKGAARAMGVTAIEQLAHALEEVLDGLRREAIAVSPQLFTACYHALDAIQATQAVYESGEITPPIEALQALAELQGVRQEDEPAAVTAEQAAFTGPAGPVQESAAPTKAREAAAPEKAPLPAEGSGPEAMRTGDETIRVRVSKLDTVMAQLSELLVTKIRASQRLDQIRQFQEVVGQMQKEWLPARSSYSRLVRLSLSSETGFDQDVLRLVSYAGANQEQMRVLVNLVNEMAREVSNDTMHMSLVIDELEEEIKRIRMLPLSTICGPFGRMVRDLAQEAGKEAILEIHGADTELDKRVLEEIKDPLVHLLRNAVDHGIELPEERLAAGKPRCGMIRLSAEQLGKDVLVTISDDGAGLNLDAIRKVAAQRRGVSPHSLGEPELAEAIFQPGISTRLAVNSISGRGVGLDVVRRNVEDLNGRIDLTWKAGQGTSFRLSLPLGLSSSRGLLVRISGQLFAIQLNAVERILRIDRRQITSLEGRDTIRYEGRPITLVRMGDLLGLPRPVSLRSGEYLPVIVLAVAERRMAFAVDELAGEQEVVIKDLGKQLRRVGGIAGATVMGDGSVVLILNIADLFKLALQGACRPVISSEMEADAGEEKNTRRRILIVDDSITTRTLEKNILEAAGYSIQVAVDGQEALNLIISSGELPNLVVSDIVMPRMTGIELTRRIKSDPRLSQVPVILVSSLDSTEDKAQGIDAGADAYIVKGQFDQNNLLETIEQLI